MALSFLLSSQTAFAVAHQIEHFHHHAHNHALLPDDLLGDVIYLTHNAGAAPDSTSHSGTSELPDDQPSGSVHHHGPGPVDHQHGNSSIVFLISQNLILINCALPRFHCDFVPQSPVTFNPSGPDHPPKLNLEIRV
jgi:hypothetical protein